jgi:hypothetical protein
MRRSMAVGGLPEMWTQLNEEKKDELRDVIYKLRQLGTIA